MSSKIFLIQVSNMCRYFARVQLSQWIFFAYSIALPVFAVTVSMNGASYHGDTMQVLTDIAPWLGFITLSNAMSANTDLIVLREQGYLKQYKTIVSSPSVFVLSKQLIWFAMQLIECLIISVYLSIAYSLNPGLVLYFCLVGSLLAYWPQALFFQFLLVLPINDKTVAVVNYLITALAFGLTLVATNVNSAFQLINPIMLSASFFNLTVDWSQAVAMQYSGLLLIAIGIGLLTRRRMPTVPVRR